MRIRSAATDGNATRGARPRVPPNYPWGSASLRDEDPDRGARADTAGDLQGAADLFHSGPHAAQPVAPRSRADRSRSRRRRLERGAPGPSGGKVKRDPDGLGSGVPADVRERLLGSPAAVRPRSWPGVSGVGPTRSSRRGGRSRSEPRDHPLDGLGQARVHQVDRPQRPDQRPRLRQALRGPPAR